MIALVEEVSEDSGAVHVVVAAQGRAAVQGPGGRENEGAQVLQVVVGLGEGHFLHPGSGRLLPPTAVVALIVGKLQGVEELVSGRDPKGLRLASSSGPEAGGKASVGGIGEVVVQIDITGRRDGAALLGSSSAVINGAAAPHLAKVDVVFVTPAGALIGLGNGVTELVDFQTPDAVEDGGGNVHIVGDSIAVFVGGVDGVDAGGGVVDAEVPRRTHHRGLQPRARQDLGETAAELRAQLLLGVAGLYEHGGAAG